MCVFNAHSIPKVFINCILCMIRFVVFSWAIGNCPTIDTIFKKVSRDNPLYFSIINDYLFLASLIKRNRRVLNVAFLFKHYLGKMHVREKKSVF